MPSGTDTNLLDCNLPLVPGEVWRGWDHDSFTAQQGQNGVQVPTLKNGLLFMRGSAAASDAVPAQHGWHWAEDTSGTALQADTCLIDLCLRQELVRFFKPCGQLQKNRLRAPRHHARDSLHVLPHGRRRQRELKAEQRFEGLHGDAPQLTCAGAVGLQQ